MAALLIIINILLILIAIMLIVCVLMQEGNRAGLGAIGGGAETFFGKSKAKGIEGKLQMITKVGAGVFIVLAIVATAMTARVNNTSVDSIAPVPIEEGAETEPADDGLIVTTEDEAAQPEAADAPADEAAETAPPVAVEETPAAEATPAAEETPAAEATPAA